MTTIQYYLIKLRLAIWLVSQLTRNSEAVLMLTGGDWRNPALRQAALEMMLSEVRDGDNRDNP